MALSWALAVLSLLPLLEAQNPGLVNLTALNPALVNLTVIPITNATLEQVSAWVLLTLIAIGNCAPLGFSVP
jgi:hypothetical protein